MKIAFRIVRPDEYLTAENEWFAVVVDKRIVVMFPDLPNAQWKAKELVGASIVELDLTRAE